MSILCLCVFAALATTMAVELRYLKQEARFRWVGEARPVSGEANMKFFKEGWRNVYPVLARLYDETSQGLLCTIVFGPVCAILLNT